MGILDEVKEADAIIVAKKEEEQKRKEKELEECRRTEKEEMERKQEATRYMIQKQLRDIMDDDNPNVDDLFFIETKYQHKYDSEVGTDYIWGKPSRYKKQHFNDKGTERYMITPRIAKIWSIGVEQSKRFSRGRSGLAEEFGKAFLSMQNIKHKSPGEGWTISSDIIPESDLTEEELYEFSRAKKKMEVVRKSHSPDAQQQGNIIFKLDNPNKIEVKFQLTLREALLIGKEKDFISDKMVVSEPDEEQQISQKKIAQQQENMTSANKGFSLAGIKSAISNFLGKGER